MSPLLEVDGVEVRYRQRTGGLGRPDELRAVDGVSLTIAPGESLAVVGESGCGKSSLARAIMGLEPIAGGEVRLDGTPLGARRPRSVQRRAQMVFQDPLLSLNPRRRVRSVLAELLLAHRLATRATLDDRCESLLAEVGLPRRVLDAYPHELSGGQRQRVGIARALALEPDLLVADEPVSALDVSVQATILALLADLQQRLGLALLFISHDLGVVRHLCDRVAVMYLGRIVEQGPARAIFERPRHPYTQALLRAAPSLVHPRPPGVSGLRGEPPSPTEVHAGCRFAGRCAHAVDACRTDDPELAPVTTEDGGDGDDVARAQHEVACHVRPASDAPASPADRAVPADHPLSASSSRGATD